MTSTCSCSNIQYDLPIYVFISTQDCGSKTINNTLKLDQYDSNPACCIAAMYQLVADLLSYASLYTPKIYQLSKTNSNNINRWLSLFNIQLIYVESKTPFGYVASQLAFSQIYKQMTNTE